MRGTPVEYSRRRFMRLYWYCTPIFTWARPESLHKFFNQAPFTLHMKLLFVWRRSPTCPPLASSQPLQRIQSKSGCGELLSTLLASAPRLPSDRPHYQQWAKGDLLRSRLLWQFSNNCGMWTDLTYEELRENCGGLSPVYTN